MKSKKKNVRGGRFSRRIFDAMDMPVNADPFAPETVISISDNMTLSISKCKKILLYHEDLVRLRIGKYILEARGRCFSLKSGQGGCLELDGIIDSVEFVSCGRRT